MNATTASKNDMTSSAYLFECKGIQRYIFGSGRLRQVIGASDLIAGIARSDGDDVLKPVFAAMDLVEPAMSRRAGASFCAHADGETLARFRRLWRIVAGVRYPGLEFSDVEPAVAGTDLEAAQGAYSRLTAVRENSTAFLPPTGHPFVATNPRTGLIAVARSSRDANEYLDALGEGAYRRGEALAEADGVDTDRLAADFIPGAEANTDAPYRFPRHFEPADATARNPAFPFPGRDRRIGVVHADLSGLGQVFQSLMGSAKRSRDIFRVATAIEGAIVAAARSACAATLLPGAIDPSDKPEHFGHLLGRDRRRAGAHKMRIVPARPVLLGGDDLTIIVRADLAVDFSERFLIAVENETAKAFTALREQFPTLPERLSACAGIAIVSAGHPFTVAERLAEGLCDSAKMRAKSRCPQAPYPSYLDFAVVTSTIDESLASWRAREQTIAAGSTEDGDPVSTAAGPRRVDGEHADDIADSLRSLLDLAEALNAAPGRGKLLEVLGLRHDSKDSAQTAWRRFWTVLASDSRAVWEQLHVALKTCRPESGDDDPPDLDRSIALVSDALELLDVGAAPHPCEAEAEAKS